MASIEKNEDRHAIPRLRSFAAAVAFNELNSLTPVTENPFTAQMLEDVLTDWQLEPGISVAADLVSSAIVLGKEPLAKEAANFLLAQKEVPTAARKMAAVCLGIADPLEITPGVKSIHAEVFSANAVHDHIHRIRVQLHVYPADPILWINFASLYVSVGQDRPAHRAVRAALSLAPQNRFVLRSAARILLHLNKGDEALALIGRADALKTDPWILSADLSITAALKGQSERIALAQRMTENDKFSPYDASELAAEIATIRALDGNTHAAKKLLRRSMQSPCENALAQAAWLARIPGMPGMPAQQTVSFEANALVARQKGELKESLQQTRHWLADQPFSHNPAQAGSFVASRIDNHRASIKFAEQGLKCNPDDFTLLNNLAFSAARNGEIQRAKDALRRVKGADLSEMDKQVLQATYGLIAFREGDLATGRLLYEEAINVFKKDDDAREAVALAYQAMEELRAGTEEASGVRAAALLAGKKRFQRAEDLLLIKQLEDFGKDSAPIAKL